jgi:hypothetical protein
MVPTAALAAILVVKVDWRDCKIVHQIVMERLHQFELDYATTGGHMHVTAWKTTRQPLPTSWQLAN